MPASHIAPGYPAVSSYLCMRDAATAIEFYKAAFGAVERMRMASPDGRVMHAEVMIGDGLVMLADEFLDWGLKGSQTIGGSPVIIHVYVPDVDAMTAQAEAAGATVIEPPKDQFYGDRSSRLRDPFGHLWSLVTHVEDVTPEEMQRRFETLFGG